MTQHVDFAIVGAGIAGASIAYELADRADIALLEREPLAGYHTTGRSAATWIAGYERGVVRALTTASKSLFVDPPVEFASGPLSHPLPMMIVGREDQKAAMDELIAHRAPGTLVIDEAGAREACPALREGYVGSALLEQDALGLDVHAIHQGFLDGARRRGALIVTGAGVENLSRRPSAWEIDTTKGPFSAGTLINASGAWADETARMAGLEPLGLIPYRRTAFAFPAPTGSDTSGWAFVADVDEDFYFKPEGAHFMGCLSEETPMIPHDVRPEEIDVALAIDRINAATTLGIRHVSRSWAGLRTFAPDRDPVIGPDPRQESFFWLAGQGGFGIMTAPAVSRLAASLATGAGVPGDLVNIGITEAAVTPGRLIS